ncbi:MAG: Fis family transcriptional regulator [Marinomonas sp.]
MKKTDKKHEKAIVTALTRVCDQALEAFEGFQWLTHQVDFNDMSRSIKVTCVFETRAQVSRFIGSPASGEKRKEMSRLIQSELKPLGIQLQDSFKQIKFDSEEACLEEHQGKWNHRLGNL